MSASPDSLSRIRLKRGAVACARSPMGCEVYYSLGQTGEPSGARRGASERGCAERGCPSEDATMTRGQVCLTGIKPTGTPHIETGSARSSRRSSWSIERRRRSSSSRTTTRSRRCTTPKSFARLVHEVAATWLALGLDPARVLFYRQSESAGGVRAVVDSLVHDGQGAHEPRARVQGGGAAKPREPASPTRTRASTWASTAIRS